jgi:hypothetical protein
MEHTETMSMAEVGIKAFFGRLFHPFLLFALFTIGIQVLPSVFLLWYVQLPFVIIIGLMLPWGFARSLLLCFRGGRGYRVWLTPVIFLLCLLAQMSFYVKQVNGFNGAMGSSESTFSTNHNLISSLNSIEKHNDRMLIAGWIYSTFGALVPIQSGTGELVYHTPLAESQKTLAVAEFDSTQRQQRTLQAQFKRLIKTYNMLMIWHSISFLIVFVVSMAYHRKKLAYTVAKQLSHRKRHYYHKSSIGFIGLAMLITLAPDLAFYYSAIDRNGLFAFTPLLVVTSLLLPFGLMRMVAIYGEQRFNFCSFIIMLGFILLFVYQLLVSVALLNSISSVDYGKRHEIAKHDVISYVFEQMSSGHTLEDKHNAATHIYWEFGVAFFYDSGNKHFVKFKPSEADYEQHEIYRMQRRATQRQYRSNMGQAVNVNYRFSTLLIGFFVGFIIALWLERRRMIADKSTVKLD